jgi:hypothetical protein
LLVAEGYVAEGYDVRLLPIVLGSAETLFKCLDHATQQTDIPNARRKKPYSKLHLHSLQNPKPNDVIWKYKRPPQEQGEGSEAVNLPSHPNLVIDAGRYPFTPHGVYFYFYIHSGLWEFAVAIL